jgi:hypothetical protein
MFIHPTNQDPVQLGRIVSDLSTTHPLVSRLDSPTASHSRAAIRMLHRLLYRTPAFQLFRFPAVRSILDLYRLHRKITELLALSPIVDSRR